ncbi:type II toxin-antitoxin system VapC family toxin [Mucilaginibacter psychrotolerans]|uniref:Ribonuclease VapC n=1 Tax=Mucilaginibacter psychrotolerans TaxID=1524096 RepID=A0A4Y8S4U0_9SPHI|nr:type II toxin-antitoxin system VapC family toxin [Mucilaginibacter psychrotolerans]TFF33922.1 type II toxin-antitoxin system VapC family toxin [Mucilaginibacter psychrotolerans]
MVVDTCIFIDHIRSKDRTNTALANLPADEPVYVSVVTLFELYCGATSPDKKQHIVDLTEDLNLLPFNADVAAKAGEIYQSIKRRNRNISVQDIMIAATCLIFDQPVLTRNKKDFMLVDDLKVLR